MLCCWGRAAGSAAAGTRSCAALGQLHGLGVVLHDGLWARLVGTAGLLLACGDAEFRAFGNLGLGARLRFCRATGMDI